MNYNTEYNNSKSFYTMAWVGFSLSFIGMIAGMAYLEADIAMKGFITMSYLFSVISCFTVAKVVRDKHEADKFLNKLESTKVEKFMAEHVEV